MKAAIPQPPMATLAATAPALPAPPAQARPAAQAKPARKPTKRAVAASSAKGGKPRRGPKSKRAAAAAVLLADVESLATQWKASLETYRLNNEARLRQIRAALRSHGDAENGFPSLKDAEKLHDHIRGLRLKPKKGRLRDLRHAEEALHEVLGRLPEA